MRKLVLASFSAFLFLAVGFADEPYHQPPPDVLHVLNAPSTPEAVVSPSGAEMLLVERILYPPISDLARPMLRIAGLRIDPGNNGPHNAFLYRSVTLQRLDGNTAAVKVALPGDAEVTLPVWSPDGKRFAFTNMTHSAVELWIGDGGTGQVRKVEGIRVNAALSSSPTPFNPGRAPLQWMPDSRSLLVEGVPEGRGAPPQEGAVSPGPHTQESFGKAGPAPTYEDLLKNAHDEELFDYYAASQLVFIDCVNNSVKPYGKAAIFASVEPSPNGQDVLVARVHKPYSYFHPFEAFPKEVEVWDRAGKTVYQVASLPLADRVPIEGVPTGPRNYHWIPTEPASVYWVEAMDGGNPKETVPHRDRILVASLPSAGAAQPRELMKVEQRFQRIEFGESGTFALVNDYERNKRWVRTFSVDLKNAGAEPKLIWARNSQDRYKDPGTPEMRVLPNGKGVIRQSGNAIFLESIGATPQGDRPFLDRFDMNAKTAEHVFRCDEAHYETVVALLDDAGNSFLTRRESPTEPPNYFVRSAGKPDARAVTHYPDPTPELRKISKQLVTYKRADGVPLSFTLYLPPDYKQGTRLPTVVWAYPYEYNDADTAGQISGSTKRFTIATGVSQIFFALRGYAVLANAAMPVIGDPTTVNNTYLEQIVMDAKAAIDKAAEMGVTDPARVGVGGHSYGAFMTANLLSHSSLFKAGIAESGAYNRTLTPFGFQTERRTIWEAPDVYLKMSPFLSADKVKSALLLVHGEADDNTGTFPIQSERMYAAVRGNGGVVRLVTLPYEAHGYRGRESIEHVLSEEISWFDKYVKDANANDALNATLQ